MSPQRKPGGHEQGLKRTIVVAVDPDVRKDLEDEADKRTEDTGGKVTISDLVREALDEYLYEDPE